MKVATAKQAACHESTHAVALAVRTRTLTESIYVGSKPDGTCAAGVNGISKIPFEAGSVGDWIIYNLSGYAAEKLFDPAGANREGAFRDDVVAEKIFRAVWQANEWDATLAVIEEEIKKLVLNHWACIKELAAALLAVAPRTVAVLDEKHLVYKLGADKIEQILRKHALQTPFRFGDGYSDEQFTTLLERHALNLRIGEASPILAAEFYNHRRFAEAKRIDTLERLDDQMWINHYGNAKVEILER